MASAFDSIEKAVLITSSYNEAERLASDFIALLGEEKVHTFLGEGNSSFIPLTLVTRMP